MEGRLGSERVVVQSPMSYSGSAARIWRMTDVNVWVRWLLAVPAAVLLIVVVWVVVTGWYLLVGLLVAPWRLIRRGGRKRKRDRLRHRELLDR